LKEDAEAERLVTESDDQVTVKKEFNPSAINPHELMRLKMFDEDLVWLAMYDDDLLILNVIDKLQNGPGFEHKFEDHSVTVRDYTISFTTCSDAQKNPAAFLQKRVGGYILARLFLLTKSQMMHVVAAKNEKLVGNKCLLPE